MEAHDVFTQRNEIGDDDPFAGSDFGDWEQTEPEQPTPVESLPEIEDPNIESGYDGPIAREGEVSPNHPAHPQWHQAPENPDTNAGIDGQAAADAAMAVEQGPPPPETTAVAAPAPALPPSAPPEAPPVPPEPQIGSQGVAQKNEEPLTVEPVAPQGPQSSAGVQAPPEAPPEVPQAAGVVLEDEDPGVPWDEEAERREQEYDVPIDTDGLPDPPSPSGSPSSELESSFPPPEVSQDGDVAPVPDETKDKRGRVTHRRYVILRQDTKGKFTQLDWYEDSKRKLTNRTASGAKRQTVVLARGTEDALKFGYLALGGPQDGVDLVAVAAAYFQVKHVAPKPPEPAKQRLSIS